MPMIKSIIIVDFVYFCHVFDDVQYIDSYLFEHFSGFALTRVLFLLYLCLFMVSSLRWIFADAVI